MGINRRIGERLGEVPVSTEFTRFGRVSLLAFRTPEWQEIMKRNPGVENYHRTEAKFAEQLWPSIGTDLRDGQLQ